MKPGSKAISQIRPILHMSKLPQMKINSTLRRKIDTTTVDIANFYLLYLLVQNDAEIQLRECSVPMNSLFIEYLEFNGKIYTPENLKYIGFKYLFLLGYEDKSIPYMNVYWGIVYLLTQIGYHIHCTMKYKELHIKWIRDPYGSIISRTEIITIAQKFYLWTLNRYKSKISQKTIN